MFIGEGPERSRIESHAFDFRPAALRFTGWLSRDRLSCELEKADLLVVPSLWPEPFGLVGLEAALKGVPAVGFAHGGIVDWLKDGTTGGLANAEPPTSESLAEAALRCLTSKEVFERLSLDSLDFATAWPGIDRHVVDLMQLIAHSTSP